MFITPHEPDHNAHYENFETRYTYTHHGFEWIDHIHKDLKETWAAGVDWYWMNKKYSVSERKYGYHDDYKGIIQDLIYTKNTYAKRAGFVGTEHVSGFTISQIETAVFKSSSLNELRNNLRQMYPSASSPGLYYSTQDLNNLFRYWRTQ